MSRQLGAVQERRLGRLHLTASPPPMDGPLEVSWLEDGADQPKRGSNPCVQPSGRPWIGSLVVLTPLMGFYGTLDGSQRHAAGPRTGYPT